MIRSSRLAALACLLALGPMARAAEIELNQLQSGHPLQVQDATPLESGVILHGALSSGTEDGRDGVFLRPGAIFGLGHGLELSAAWREGVSHGHAEVDALELEGQLQLVGSSRAPWALSATAGFETPTQDFGAGAEVGAQSTFTLRHTRVHQNLRWQSQKNDTPRGQAGVAADHDFGDRVLLMGDLMYEHEFASEKDRWTAEAGANVRLSSRILLDAVFGVNRHAQDTDPRFLVGIFGRL